MIFAAILVLIALALVMCASTLAQSRLGGLSLPFQAGLITLIWLVPQLFAAEADPSLPRLGLVLMVGLAILALAATWIGWNVSAVRLAPADRLKSAFEAQLPALFWSALGFTLVAVAIQVLMFAQPASALAARQPSGLITILRTFAALNPVAFGLALTLFLLRPQFVTAAILVLSLAAFGQELAIQIKRTSFFEIATASLLALYAARGVTVPRRVQITALPCAFLFINLIHEVRRRSGYRVGEDGSLELARPNFADLSDLDWISVGQARASTSYFEVTNGVLTLQHLFETGIFGWGRVLWNGFVFRWVPGQFVGAETKAGLTFDMTATTEIVAQAGFAWKLGTTTTGFTQPFADFAIFGVLVFLANALLAGAVFRRALSGDLVAFALAAPILSAAVVSLTHDGYALAFSLPLLCIAGLGLSRLFRSHPAQRVLPAAGEVTS